MNAIITVFLAAAFLFAPRVDAQESAKALSGFVSDKDGPVTHAAITAEKATAPTETDDEGFFSLSIDSSVKEGELVWVHIHKDRYVPSDRQIAYSSKRPYKFTLTRLRAKETNRRTEGFATSISSNPKLILNQFYDDKGKFFPGNEHILVSNPVLNDSGIPVLQSGAVLTTTLACSCRPDQSVVVSRLELRVSYHSGTIGRYQYDSSSSNISGRAIIESLSYIIQLDGNNIFVARVGAKAGEKPLTLPGHDLLADGEAISLRKQQDPQPLKLHIGTVRNGLYDIELVAVWSAGGVNQETHSQRLLLYREE